MELIQIIIDSIKYFSLVSIIVLSISYIIYKIKDRKRVKPYMNTNKSEAPAEPTPIATPVVSSSANHVQSVYPSAGDFTQQSLHDQRYIQKPNNNVYQPEENSDRPALIYHPLPEPDYSIREDYNRMKREKKNMKKKISNERFKVVNDRQVVPVYATADTNPGFDFQTSKVKGNNIYDLYSDKNAAPMHKLRFSGAAR